MGDENRETFSCGPFHRLCGARDGNRETFSCGTFHRQCGARDGNRETFSCSPLHRLCGARDGNHETFSCSPFRRLCSAWARHALPFSRTSVAFFRMMRPCMMGGGHIGSAFHRVYGVCRCAGRQPVPPAVRRVWDGNRETFSCSPLQRLCGMDAVLSGSAGAMRHGFAR